MAGLGWRSLVGCCFTSAETVGLLGTGAQDGHLDFHAAAWDGGQLGVPFLFPRLTVPVPVFFVLAAFATQTLLRFAPSCARLPLILTFFQHRRTAESGNCLDQTGHAILTVVVSEGDNWCAA